MGLFSSAGHSEVAQATALLPGPWYLKKSVNSLRPGQNGCLFADDIFKCIFLNENVWISIYISLKFVPNGWIDNIPALVGIMAWCWKGDKPLSEPVTVGLLTHTFVTQPQWVKLYQSLIPLLTGSLLKIASFGRGLLCQGCDTSWQQG